MANSLGTRGVHVAAAMLLAGTALPALAQTAPTSPPAPTASSSSSTATAPAATQDGAGQTQPTQVDDTAQAPADPSATGNEDIVVTGFRASLQSQTDAKRDSIGFTDSIFAEDIGKFPDTNIAESVNRIPGVTIAREVTGEGSNVAIRGLGTNFTRVLLNGTPVAIASVRFDAQSTNREVDLDLIPTELFTQLTVSKSPVASQLEGGAAGTVNLRSARPFDNPKPYISYGLQGSKVSSADKWGYRGYALASATFGDFGILVGGAAVKNRFRVDGFETIGWTNPNLTAAQRPTGANPTGGGNWTIPATVPANAGNGLAPGTVIDQAFLLSRNPGATIDQIDNGLLPRLGRPRTEVGERTRYNALASAEWRPSDAFHFYVDGFYATRDTDFTRTSMNWALRNGAAIPLNTSYDKADCAAGCTVTGGTFANAQFFLEYRPYRDTQDYYGVNPGAEFTVNDFIKGDVQLNWTKSHFRRESPTVLVITPPSSGVTVTYANAGGGIPAITSNVDLNNPANFGWAGGGRVNLNGEERDTETKGIRGSLLFGDERRFSVRVGAAYDDVKRRITPFDNTNPWQALICGNNPSVVLPGPNRQPVCDGANLPGTVAPPGYPNYAAYGTGYSAGFPPLVYRGSVIPTAAVPGFLAPGDNGFITVDWDRFKQATNYDALLAGATETGAGSSGANGGLIREKVTGTFVEGNGIIDIGDDDTLRLNGGVRYVRTEQIVGGRTTIPDPRNTRGGVTCPGTSPTFALDGSCYPVLVNFTETSRLYSNFLPSASLAYGFGRKAVARASVSRTLTRPDPNQLLPGASFVQPSADVGTLGNNALNPYISDNIDLGFEYYTGGEGVIAVAAFRKSITGFTVNGLTTVPFSALEPFGITFGSLTQAQQDALRARVAGTGVAPEQAPIQIQQQVNADGKLKVNGLEFQLTQPLDFLTRYIGVEGFGFQGNLTIIDQRGEGTGAPAIALGVAPTTYTATGYYEGNGISARLSYTYNEGSQNSGLNQNGIPAAAIFGRDYGQLDFSGNVDLSRIFGQDYLPTLVVNVINITKTAQSSYFQFPNATFSEYQPGRTLLVGIRGRF